MEEVLLRPTHTFTINALISNMKIFIFFFLIGLSWASSSKELEDASHELVFSFLEGMEKAPSLADHMGLEGQEAHMAQQVEDEIKTELGKTLKEGIDKVLEKVKEAVDQGREVQEELLDKLKDLRERLREVKGDLSERGRELLKELKEKARDYLKTFLEKYGLNKRSADDRLEEALSELNMRDILKKIKEHLKKNVDPELLKEKLEKIFDQGTEILQVFLRTLKEKGKKKLEILIDHLLGDDDEEESRESRSIKEYWEKIKDYFKDLKIDLQEKYMKFGEWVKTVWDKGMEHSKDKMENIKAIAKEFARHAKNVSKEVGAEAKEFFRQYKDELGNVWEELKEAFKQIKDRQD